MSQVSRSNSESSGPETSSATFALLSRRFIASSLPPRRIGRNRLHRRNSLGAARCVSGHGFGTEKHEFLSGSSESLRPSTP